MRCSSIGVTTNFRQHTTLMALVIVALVALVLAKPDHAQTVQTGYPLPTINQITFLSADTELNTVARAAGMTVGNPNSHL